MGSERLDRLTRAVARAMSAPASCFTVIEPHRQVFLGQYGVKEPWASRRETPLSHSFCREVVAREEPVLVNDAREHPTFRGNPAILDLGVIAYAGVPVRGGAGEVVGSLCAIDHSPRAWSGEDRAVLEDLSWALTHELVGTRPTRRGLSLALRETERTLRSLIEQLSDVILVLSPGGVVHYESPSVARVLGYESGALIGRSVWELVHPQEVTGAIQRFTRAYEAADPNGWLELRLRQRSGDWGVFEVSIRNCVADPAIGGMVLTARDVTARRTAEENHRRLSRILEASPDFVCTLDPHGRALYINPSGLRLLGVQADEPLTAGMYDFYPPAETGRMVEEAIPAALRRGIWSGETLLQNAEGEQIPVYQVILSHPGETGEAEFLSVIARDIRDHKRAELLLRQSEAHFRSLIENAQDIITIVDPSGIIRYESPGIQRVLGYDPEELLGTNALEALDPVERARVSEAMSALIAAPGTIQTLEFRVNHRDGTPRVLEATAQYVPDGPQPGIVVNSRDVTERRWAEEALREREEQLRHAQKMEAVGRLAGGIAHDFNNLMMAVSGHAEMLLSGLSEDDPMRPDLHEIERAAERAAALTRQLLAFSRKQMLRPRIIDLNQVVGEMERMLGRLIGEDIRLRTVLERDLAPVRADPGQIEQVLMNLVVNARDAMPSGGSLEITTGQAELAEVREGGEQVVPAGSYVRLTVADTGSGMTPEVRERIFEPFFTTKEQGKGTGLGLSTVYGIVRQSGGHIDVESEIGEGTRFHVYLPVAAERVEDSGGGSEGGEGSTAATVLVVEDEASVRALVARILERRGYRVLAAEAGPAALELEPTVPRIDLLVTDMVMPGMSGPELARRLSERHAGLRVLYMSGYAEEAILPGGVTEPGRGFIEKPFPPDLLLQRVRELLDARSEPVRSRR